MLELPQTPPSVRSFLTFRTMGRLYGLDVARVREVSTHRVFTPVPQAPPVVRGLANLRSQIYLVLDGGVALGGPPTECTSESRLIVLHDHAAEHLSLLVEQGGDIVQVSADQIENADRAEPEGSPGQTASIPVVALCKLQGALMMVVDPGRIISALETAIR